MNRFLRRLLVPPDPLRPLGRVIDRANAANAARNWPEAEGHYARALRIDPLRDDLWVQYGHALKEQGKLAEAAQAYGTAVETEPGSADALLHLGHLHKRMGRGDEAVAIFRQGLAIDPRHPEMRAEVTALSHGGAAVPAMPAFRDADDLPVRSADRVERHGPRPPLAWPGRIGTGRRRDPIAFLHLHKTGGLTLDDVLAAHFAPGRICPVKDDHLHLYNAAQRDCFDFFSGHFDVGALRLLRQPTATVSVFREPTARLISFYRFHAGHALGGKHAVNTFARMANAMSAEAFFEDERVRGAPEVFNHYLSVFSLTYAQVRAASVVTVDRVTDAVLAKAIARVRALDAVCLLERFDDGVALACRTFGVAPPIVIKARNQTNVLARQMKGQAPPPVAMTPRLRAALADLVRFDEPIYAAAKAEFERRWQTFAATGGDSASGA